MTKYFLFGTVLPLTQARDLLTQLTGQHLKRSYNDWYGDYHTTIGPMSPRVRIITNAPDPEGYMPEDDFTEPAVLVYVSDAPADVETRLLGSDQLQLLRVEDL
jgi:hypothetical protein